MNSLPPNLIKERQLFAKGAVGIVDFTRDRVVVKLSYGCVANRLYYTRATAVSMLNSVGESMNFAANVPAVTDMGMMVDDGVICYTDVSLNDLRRGSFYVDMLYQNDNPLG